MSFINMLANDVWTEAEIVNRTEAMVRSRVSLADELVLNRKIEGARAGQYTLSLEDEAQMAELAAAGMEAQMAGIAARTDMLTLLEVFEVEAAEKRLALPVVEPLFDDEFNIVNQAEVDADNAERAIAQERIDAADEEVMTWVEARRPTPEPEEPTDEVIE
jgi:hypothetical protein